MTKENSQGFIILVIIVIIMFGVSRGGCTIKPKTDGDDGNGDGNGDGSGGGTGGGGTGGGGPTPQQAPTQTLLGDCVEVCQSVNYNNGKNQEAYPNVRCPLDTIRYWYGTPTDDFFLSCCCWNDPETMPDPITPDAPEPYCTDNDYTQQNFDYSLTVKNMCTDNQGTYWDICEGDLLKEWHCPAGGDDIECKHTILNCAGYLGEGAVCKDGVCVAGECTQNLDCYYSIGEGWVCRDGNCVEVTHQNCDEIVQNDANPQDNGVWDIWQSETPMSCYEYCVYNCLSGCGSFSSGGTWGKCCGYSCS